MPESLNLHLYAQNILNINIYFLILRWVQNTLLLYIILHIGSLETEFIQNLNILQFDSSSAKHLGSLPVNILIYRQAVRNR